MNSFKEINDTHGHLEGDSALILFSDAIKSVITDHAGFAARYGGDEFVWAWTLTNKSTPDALNAEIKEKLEQLGGGVKKDYSLTFCTGYVVCDDPKRSLDSYIKAADEMLYKNKRIFHGIDAE